MVSVETIIAGELEQKIQEAKEQGKRILALSPSQLEKTTRTGKIYKVVEYVLATQN